MSFPLYVSSVLPRFTRYQSIYSCFPLLNIIDSCDKGEYTSLVYTAVMSSLTQFSSKYSSIVTCKRRILFYAFQRQNLSTCSCVNAIVLQPFYPFLSINIVMYFCVSIYYFYTCHYSNIIHVYPNNSRCPSLPPPFAFPWERILLDSDVDIIQSWWQVDIICPSWLAYLSKTYFPDCSES